MEFDPAIILFGAVVVLLVAILIGIIVVATWPWMQRHTDEWIIPDPDNLGSRLAAIGQEIAALKADIDDLYKEVELLQGERDQLLMVLIRVAELLEQFPRSGGR